MLFLVIQFCACQKEEFAQASSNRRIELSIQESNCRNDIQLSEDDISEMQVDLKADNNEILEMICIEDDEFEDFVKHSVTVLEDEEIQNVGWIEDNICYRVSIGRKYDIEGEYRHTRDYIIVNGEASTSIEVTYPSKLDSTDFDRYVYDACDFEVKFVDVTFDGNKDIVISLGHQGVAGTRVSCAYVFDDGEYKYIKSFENIPNYEINDEEHCIEGSFGDKTWKYVYEDGIFKSEEEN